MEINIVDVDGKIVKSTDAKVVNKYNMNKEDQSREFVDKLKLQECFVQEYGPRGEDSEWRKYAAYNLAGGGFIQVGYNTDQFHDKLDEFVIDSTKNRHVGTSGFVVVLDETLTLVHSGQHVSVIGIQPPEEMKKEVEFTTVLAANERGREYLSAIRKTAEFPIITNYSDVKNLTGNARKQKDLADYADTVYALCEGRGDPAFYLKSHPVITR